MKDVKIITFTASGGVPIQFPVREEAWETEDIDIIGCDVALLAGEAQAMHTCNSHRVDIMAMEAGAPGDCQRLKVFYNQPLPFPGFGKFPLNEPHIDIHVEFTTFPYTIAYATFYTFRDSETAEPNGEGTVTFPS